MCLYGMIIHSTAFILSVLFVFTTENKVFFPRRQADTVYISPSILFTCFAEHKEMFLNLTKCIFNCRCVCLVDPWANTHKSWAQPLPNSPIQGKLPLKLMGAQHPIIISLDWTSCEPTQCKWGSKMFPYFFFEEKWEMPCRKCLIFNKEWAQGASAKGQIKGALTHFHHTMGFLLAGLGKIP